MGYPQLRIVLFHNFRFILLIFISTHNIKPSPWRNYWYFHNTVRETFELIKPALIHAKSPVAPPTTPWQIFASLHRFNFLFWIGKKFVWNRWWKNSSCIFRTKWEITKINHGFLQRDIVSEIILETGLKLSFSFTKDRSGLMVWSIKSTLIKFAQCIYRAKSLWVAIKLREHFIQISIKLVRMFIQDYCFSLPKHFFFCWRWK